MALRGNFSETDPSDVLQLLAFGGKTGVLRVVDGTRVTEIAFENGKLVDAFDGVNRGEEAIVALLAARSGSFVFKSDEMPAEKTMERDVSSILLLAAERLDGLARARATIGRPTARPYVVQEADTSASTLTDHDRAVLALIDGKRTVGEIVAGSGLGPQQAYASLSALLDQGLIDVLSASDEQNPLTTEWSEPSAEVELEAIEAPHTPEDLKEIIAFLRSS